MSDVTQSINIMIGILLSSVGYIVFWIFKYDDWYPNDIPTHDSSSGIGVAISHGDDAKDEGVEV